MNLSLWMLLLLVLVTLCFLTAGGLYARYWLRMRFAALEESLRTYNTANAAIGRHVTALENELQELRKQHQVAAVTNPSRTSASRFRPAQGKGNELFSDAELRLAQRLKAGLGSLRLD